jgi:GTP-binding protein
MKPVVAIVGRPNVGKSTLFNRIVGRRQAIVQDEPGVTRDRNYADADHSGRAFVVVDTGGFDPEASEGMLAIMKRQVEIALEEADALVLVFDVREGLVPTDEAIWDLVRRSGRRTYVTPNKVDGAAQDPAVAEFWRLGVPELFPVSAERGTGVAELLDRLVEDLDCPPAEDEDEEAKGEGPARIAIVGRPNVGKSTLANALLGRERYLTSDVPGTTRDAIDTPFSADGRDYVLVDTAGVRRPRRVERGVERQSVARTIQAIERAHVALLLIDAAEGATDQDKKIASLVIERGRGLVLVVNKWDLVSGPGAGDEQTRKLRDEFGFASFAPHVFTSALKGRNVHKVLPVADRVHANLFRRVPTHELNKFFEEVVRTHPPMIGGTGSARIRYLTQAQVNPPTILLFAKGRGTIPQNYLRFILRELRERYDFEGVPVRLIAR